MDHKSGGIIHHQLHKLTKNKGGIANENALLKLLYASMLKNTVLKASKKWTHPTKSRREQNWNLTLSQLSIHFEGRIDEYLDL